MKTLTTKNIILTLLAVLAIAPAGCATSEPKSGPKYSEQMDTDATRQEIERLKKLQAERNARENQLKTDLEK